MSITHASPLPPHQVNDLSSESSGPARRQSSSGFEVVAGIQEFGVHPRLEIRQLEKDVAQFNIYLLGLARFQATDQSEKLSYYQIAGIHGRPYIPWDGVGQGAGPGDPGYCMHVSNIFLPWHRPYMALYEQVLYQHIVEAVNEFPAGAVRQRYAAAALSWRHPYWDWAADPPVGESVFPDSLGSPFINVTMPNGTMAIANPLYSYEFHPLSVSDFYYSPFAEWNVTMRDPSDWSAAAYPQDNLVGPALDNSRVSFQDRLYNLFTNYNNFSEFGNEAWMSPSVGNADSLESIHDAIHSITGSAGHMTYLDYSAFDPLFWLHHAMIDRCFALWQAIYNESYVEPMAALDQTFAFNPGQVLDVNTPLLPFHSDVNGGFWTAASARSPATFGYTYSDLGNGSVSAVMANVNKLYGNTASSDGLSRRTMKREPPTEANPGIQAPEEVVDGRHKEYLANIVSQKFALTGSYAIYIFLGLFDDTPNAWPLSPNLVGTHAVFATLGGMQNSALPVTGTVPLTSALLAKVHAGELPCMDVATVTAYLHENLEWRVGLFDGTGVPTTELADLMITVVSAEVEPAESAEQFPRWGDFTVLTNVTEGKAGGC
ncbi:hypothetical protein LTR62_002429 [Meristemomyces frigidus]|uniref:Tyrosinase copper-binding domain-containing protein n=1 Tax=Meristemomyces frigidus TaxID=1508187 RepID=A0AAN7TJK4_9PEZI|nr:hypothetical protein LTR62_002429 [Meristemomyces frigidus]